VAVIMKKDHWRFQGGWLSAANCAASPNCDQRPAGMFPELIVIHNISLPPGLFGGDEICDLFTNCLDNAAHPYFEALKGLRVSAHFLIRRSGELMQFVPVDRRAWHAGVSSWRGRDRCNDFSIGIELEGTDSTPYTDSQYGMLARLVSRLRAEYPGIAEDALTGHSDIAPGRKTDPGPAFDWARLHDELLNITQGVDYQ
jgi:AmpD protein